MRHSSYVSFSARTMRMLPAIQHNLTGDNANLIVGARYKAFNKENSFDFYENVTILKNNRLMGYVIGSLNTNGIDRKIFDLNKWVFTKEKD